MGQLRIIEDEEYNVLKIKESQAKAYRECFETIEKELYPDLISVDSCTCLQYDAWVLNIMAEEVKQNRKPWYKRIFTRR